MSHTLPTSAVYKVKTVTSVAGETDGSKVTEHVTLELVSGDITGMSGQLYMTLTDPEYFDIFLPGFQFTVDINILV